MRAVRDDGAGLGALFRRVERSLLAIIVGRRWAAEKFGQEILEMRDRYRQVTE
jgi:hypothetical protein